ncbi:transposase [Enterococcus hirae]|uniref:transposase n=1 Tax=Enterococcus hirae TaxID=1354 RepID=UPI0039A47204
MFLNLDLSTIDEYPKTGRKGYSAHAMICAFIVMKTEGFPMITGLLDYLNNNLLIAHYCGFDITRPLPSYWSFDRFLKNLEHTILSELMQDQVLILADKGIIDTSFIGLDSTAISANTTLNNPKSFSRDKFKKGTVPTNDSDCKIGVHSASNQINERKYNFYWGYKNHVLVDCISGLPIAELTTTANIADSTVALSILADTHSFLPITECSFLADKGYDTKAIYNQVAHLYNGECFIPLNKRRTKTVKTLPKGSPICEAGLAMHRDGKFSDAGRTRQKFCCSFKRSTVGHCPCNHKNFLNGKKNRGCTKYQTIPDDLRLSIDRTSKTFKQNYSLHTECERYNARFKNAGQERMWVKNINSVRNLTTLTHISLLSIAIAAINSNNSQSYRKLKTLKRIA